MSNIYIQEPPTSGKVNENLRTNRHRNAKLLILRPSDSTKNLRRWHRYWAMDAWDTKNMQKFHSIMHGGILQQHNLSSTCEGIHRSGYTAQSISINGILKIFLN